MQMTPYGMMMTPNTKNPNSAHNQMKMGDHMMNPFMGGMGMMHPGMMHPGMGMMHPGMGMMGYGMHPYSAAMSMPLNAWNYPDHSEVEPGNAQRRLRQVKRKKKRKRKHRKKRKRNEDVIRFMF